MQTIPFFELFTAYQPSSSPLREATVGWQISRAQIEEKSRRMLVEVYSEEALDASLLAAAEVELAQLYQMETLRLIPVSQAEISGEPAPEVRQKRAAQPEKGARTAEPAESSPTEEYQAAPETQQRGESNPEEQAEAETSIFQQTEAMRQKALQGSVEQRRKKKGESGGPRRIFGGQAIKRKPLAIETLHLDMKTVVIEGDVFDVAHRELKKRGAWVISFALTDYSGSIRIHKFMDAEEGAPIISAVKEGQRLMVQGRLTINRFDNEMVLEPQLIWQVEKPARLDVAKEARVELHLHTQMSSMDALTDVKKVIERAIAWKHPAIAITDHAVVHAFPDAWNAAKGKIKVLLGIEAYFLNNVDERLVVSGTQDGSLDGPIVAFDIETTGLNPKTERLTEIGAVLLEGGEITERFQTFVKPEKPIPPEITQLTGITDEMVADAPTQEEALRAFLAFADGRPLAAHNAPFDMGFLAEGCARYGIDFTATSLDTLALAQNLLPDLSRYKLDLLARHLELPDFQHHRAVDDALTVAYLLIAFREKLRAREIHRLQEINPAMAKNTKLGKGRRMPRHLILLVQNKTGLRNLYKLVSLSHLEHFKRVPIMPKSLINENREGLLIGAACEAGEVYQAVMRGKSWQELKRIASWYDYLEIQPVSNNAFMYRPDRQGRTKAEGPEQIREWNQTIVRLGKELGKPVCATGDVHFLDPEDEIYRSILLDVKDFPDADAENPLYFRSTDEMLEEFSYLGEETAYEVVVRNTNYVAGLCEHVSPLPEGLFTPKLENSAEELQELVWGRVHELYGERPPELVTRRVEMELGDIIGCKYDVIYMSAQKLVKNSLENGYLVGSRGSVGSSVVAYMAGITEVNALPPHYRCPNCKHCDFTAGEEYGCGADMPDANCPSCGEPYEKDGFHIPFETFLGFGGDKVPDIDLNFSGEYQARAHRHTFELFGEEHVFRAGTIGTVAKKTAFGYVKKYLEKRELTVSRAEEERLTLGCTGVKRTTGQHPGGMVVIPQDKEIYDFCPVQRPADDTGTDIITTHFEYHSMESNLLKLDILGHDDPSMIRMLEDLTGVKATEIHLDDPETMSLFTSSEALGFTDDPILGPTGAVAIPEFGTGFVRGMLEDTMPEQFDTLVRLSGFSHGTDVWLGNARDLILSNTASVREAIGCRDDIMLYLIKCGMEAPLAFKIMESVRKGRGLPPGSQQEMEARGVPAWYIESCKKIKYLFPKAHAVAYVMMAFRVAWFKVHRPLAFYAAYFSIRAKAFDATTMCLGKEVLLHKRAQIKAKENPDPVEKDTLVTMEVCYEFYLRGFQFERPDLYRSDARLFLIKEETGSLIPPFTSLPGLGLTAAQSLLENRKGNVFLSEEELLDCCQKLSKSHVVQLREIGALGNMPESSQLSLF